jgi:hypothetical protein
MEQGMTDTITDRTSGGTAPEPIDWKGECLASEKALDRALDRTLDTAIALIAAEEKIERLTAALRKIDAQYEDQNLSHFDFRVNAKLIVAAALATTPHSAGTGEK